MNCRSSMECRVHWSKGGGGGLYTEREKKQTAEQYSVPFCGCVCVCVGRWININVHPCLYLQKKQKLTHMFASIILRRCI